MVYKCINVVTLSTNQNNWSTVNESGHRSHVYKQKILTKFRGDLKQVTLFVLILTKFKYNLHELWLWAS